MSLSPIGSGITGYAATPWPAGTVQRSETVPAPPPLPAAPAAQGALEVVSAAMRGTALPGATPFQAKLLGLVQRGQAAIAALRPLPPQLQNRDRLPTVEQAKQAGRAALFFAMPIGGAVAVAGTLGWLVGPLVPIVGGHVFGAVLAAAAVGHTAGFLLHGAMRLPLVTDPAQREVNSAGVTLGSAAVGAGVALALAAGVGAPITLPIVATGALLGAAPRLAEWGLARI